MKKKLEADLISIAHRILQLKNKSDINQLYLETQKLYEKLSVLRFVDEHFGDSKPTIATLEVEKEIEQIFEKSEQIKTELIEEVIVEKIIETPLENSDSKEELQSATEEIVEEPILVEEIVAEEEVIEVKETPIIPAFELDEEVEIETPQQPEAVQISFEDLLGANYNEPLFVKVQDVKNTPPEPVFEIPKETVTEEKKAVIEEPKEIIEPKIPTLNEKLAKGITIDLNDRIAFTKHLFGNSTEDYNRVLNQLITFDTFYETRDFIQEMVKPDYNNWEGKEEYEERFMDIIEKKFL